MSDLPAGGANVACQRCGACRRGDFSQCKNQKYKANGYPGAAVLLAVSRCLRSQELLVESIDANNPGDPYASLLVQEDVDTVKQWLAQFGY